MQPAARRALATMTLLALLPATCVVGVFWKCIILAGATAAALSTVHRRLTQWLGGRSWWAAAVLTAGVGAASITPLMRMSPPERM